MLWKDFKPHKALCGGIVLVLIHPGSHQPMTDVLQGTKSLGDLLKMTQPASGTVKTRTPSFCLLQMQICCPGLCFKTLFLSLTSCISQKSVCGPGFVYHHNSELRVPLPPEEHWVSSASGSSRPYLFPHYLILVRTSLTSWNGMRCSRTFSVQPPHFL